MKFIKNAKIKKKQSSILILSYILFLIILTYFSQNTIFLPVYAFCFMQTSKLPISIYEKNLRFHQIAPNLFELQQSNFFFIFTKVPHSSLFFSIKTPLFLIQDLTQTFTKGSQVPQAQFTAKPIHLERMQPRPKKKLQSPFPLGKLSTFQPPQIRKSKPRRELGPR